MSDELSDFVGRLNEDARTSLYYASSIARGYGSSLISTEYLLLGILAQSSGLGAKILGDLGITLDKAEQALDLKPGLRRLNIDVGMLSEPAQVSLKMAWQLAQERGDDYLGTEHILHGMLVQEKTSAAKLLSGMGVDVPHVVGLIEAHINSQQFTQQESIGGDTSKVRNILLEFGVDITKRAREGKIDPVIGRSKEIARAIAVISRRRKNNPLLIGEPGVGKTAIVEGLAMRIINGDVPGYLKQVKIIQIDLASVIAGTKYRGEFEDRMRRIIAAVKKSKDTLVFIDEIHLLVGAGSAEGSMDAANLLKPALARGEMKLIGATTLDEYKKYIEKDSALARRFQPILTKEPTRSEVVSILRGLKAGYENHHNVEISDEIITDIVYAADRYIKDRFMPDKAIDVLDEAAALVRMKVSQNNNLASLDDKIKQYDGLVEEAVSSEDYESAANLKTEIIRLKKERSRASKRIKIRPITQDDLARAVSSMTGIPADKLQKSEQKMLANLEAHLEKKLIGQTEAIKKVAAAIKRSRSGVRSANRPMGSFVFMGPTGVGKTELARILARDIFGSDDSLIKIDMSEFSEKHNASRLLGAPAGYVGYDDGGQLTDKIRRQPYSVVLFDEIEKAHPAIFNLLLQLLEDGKLTDGQGRSVDFTNTIIILTSNLGAEAMQKEVDLGFMATNLKDKRDLDSLHEKNAQAAVSGLKEFMKPELINRFDGIITFRALDRSEVGKIVDIMLSELADRLALKGLSLKTTSGVKKLLIKNGYDRLYGVRPLRRTIEDVIETPIAEGIIDGRFKPGAILNVSTKRGIIDIRASYESSNQT